MTGTTDNETNGWAYSPHDTGLHYFHQGRSLCGRQILWPTDRQLTAEPASTLDICPPCHGHLTDPNQSNAPDKTDRTDKSDKAVPLGEHDPDPPPPPSGAVSASTLTR